MTLTLSLANVLFGASGNERGGTGHSREEESTRIAQRVARETETALVRRIQQGDADAFRTLMHTLFEQATRLAHTFVHEQDVAEDIAQDVFARIWDMHRDWHPSVSVRAYVLGAVRHRALDVLKHRDVEARYVATEIVHGEAVDALEGDHLDRITKLASLHKAITALPERRRVALTLRYELELTHAEVGAALGVSAKAAKELILRTLDALRIELGGLR